jgi:hypothetical protein
MAVLGSQGRANFELATGHLNAAAALGAALSGLLLRPFTKFAAGYFAYAVPFAVVFPALLGATHEDVGVATVLVYQAVLVTYVAVWSVVALLLFGAKTWLSKWAAGRLARQE